MYRIAIWVALGVTLLISAPATFAVSFDCSKAQSTVEKMICANAELSRLDDDMTTRYNEVMNVQSRSSELRQAQRQWIKERNACLDLPCLKQVYIRRLSTLGQADYGLEKSSALPGYTLVTALDRQFCISAGHSLRNDIACRNDRADICQPRTKVKVNGIVQEAIVPIAHNQYGYTGVYRSTLEDIGASTLLYVDLFQGGRHRRDVEAYLVKRDELAKVLALPPGPITFDRRAERLQFSQEVNSEEFAKMLKAGIKIGNDLMPAVNLAGKLMIIQYSCVGEKVSEGDPYCPHIGGLRLLKLEDGQQPVTYCDFVETKRRRK